jgi:hypothetical protein
MNNNIEPHYVNYDFAKFLKEKGFEEHSDYNQWILAKDVDSKDESKKFICHSNDLEEYTYINEEKEHNVYHCLTIPEHWQVVEWLRINHEIEITPLRYTFSEGEFVGKKYMFVIEKYKKNFDPDLDEYHFDEEPIKSSRKLNFNSPQEAYSAAFDYIKDNNLIWKY